MNVKKISKWAEFRDAIEEIREEYGFLRSEGEVLHENQILFRGHKDSKWDLLTTLDRFSGGEWDVEKYCRVIRTCAPQIESFTGCKWDLPAYPDIKRELQDNLDKVRVHLPFYHYWVYLRHHGFPSPLLDWTRSPYIAAFFAFCDSAVCDFASVFAYIERPKGVKGGIVGTPVINVHGPYVSTHKRHFLQQAVYTTCTNFHRSQEIHSFAPHQAIFTSSNNDQDVLIKIDIPSCERMAALKDLEAYNINYFSLIQSDDSLIRHLAFSEIEKNGL